ncbi:hypothetical protein [Azospirillum baldaniorum]|uniref:hypothetical protein n=1 Tax=Azospirillum baldaniorum TaxID=1064539 RepID=UPI0006961BDE|nr:hypothetical protein [Azospirillum baldaniorum]
MALFMPPPMISMLRVRIFGCSLPSVAGAAAGPGFTASRSSSTVGGRSNIMTRLPPEPSTVCARAGTAMQARAIIGRAKAGSATPFSRRAMVLEVGRGIGGLP